MWYFIVNLQHLPDLPVYFESLIYIKKIREILYEKRTIDTWVHSGFLFLLYGICDNFRKETDCIFVFVYFLIYKSWSMEIWIFMCSTVKVRWEETLVRLGITILLWFIFRLLNFTLKRIYIKYFRRSVAIYWQ